MVEFIEVKKVTAEEDIERIKEAGEAFIKAKRALWHWFQQEIKLAKGKTDKAKQAKKPQPAGRQQSEECGQSQY